MCIVFSLQAQDATFSGKVFLQGAYDPNTFLMRTLLVQHGDFPTQQPYDREPWQYPGTETLLTVPDSLVDWILIELRSGEDFSYQEYQKAVLLKKDGTILDTNMSPLISFPGIKPGSYYLILRHRNHMPVMTAQPVNLPNQAPIDFTDTTQTPVFGGNTIGMIELTAGLFGMIAGDINQDQVLKYSGAGNDRSKVISTLVAKTGSQAITSTITGYHDEDINMDTIVKYSGPNNDPSRIIQNINQLTGSTSINTVHRTHVPGEFKCGDDLVDLRDGKTYPTVKIGRQCWMAKNLDHGQWIVDTLGQADNQLVEKFCYDNNLQNCQLYGGLYQWDEMMAYQLDQYDQGICPVGWHLPTDQEWYELESSLDPMMPMPDSLGWRGTVAGLQFISSGFQSLMGGTYDTNATFSGLNSSARYWASTRNLGGQAMYRALQQGNTGVLRNTTTQPAAMYVRCVRGLAVKTNPLIIIIDTNTTKLLSDSTMLAQGIYQYNYTAKDSLIVNTDNIIIDTTGEGYLRVVDSVTKLGPAYIMYTRQGTLEDLFIQGDLSFPLSFQDSTKSSPYRRTRIDYLEKGVSIRQSKEAMGFDFDGTVLFQDGPVTITLTSGHLIFDPEFEFDINIKDGKIRRLAFYTEDALLADALAINFNASSTYNFPEFEKTLARYSHFFGFFIGIVPVIVVVETELVATNEGSISGNLDVDFGYTNSRYVDLGLEYREGKWQRIYNVDNQLTIHPLEWSAQVSLSQRSALVPKVSVKLYGIAGPFFNAEAWETLGANLTLPAGDWDADLSVGLDAYLGAEATVFGYELASYSKQLFGKELSIWNTPHNVAKVSGDNQTATAGQQLPMPIKVQVKDNTNHCWLPVMVHFETNDGSVSTANVMTDADGYAQTSWTLGNSSGSQTLIARVVKADGSHIIGSPLQFTATVTPGSTTFTCGATLTDTRDGQQYPTVQIGTQCWMAKNLNIGTMVSGSSNQTNNSTIEKYCYSNDANNCAIYGGLYQWNEMMNYTTTPGTQGICPTGWHIPTDAEWCTLSTHLDATVNCNINGGSGTNAGGKMKATGTTHWYLPNTGATNSSGFTALGAGNRIDNGGFNNLKYDATFWSSSASSSTYAKHLYLTYDYARVHWYSHTKTRGFSVRCLRNN